MLAGLRELPQFGLTLGMADLLHARHIVLLVAGTAKREPLQRLLHGPITTTFPASLLKLHRQLHIFCDQAAWEDRSAKES